MSNIIVDKNGNKIPELTRDHNGAIKVYDPSKYQHYKLQKSLIERINEHESRIVDINNKLDSILNILLSEGGQSDTRNN